MISLWSTGISLRHSARQGWSASIDFCSMQRANPNCIEGTIGTRYSAPELSDVIDRAMAAAKQAGIQFLDEGGVAPTLYMHGDGEGEEVPSNWREILAEQCRRLGWKNAYLA